MNDIVFEVVDHKLGKIILNRPKALNALSVDMFIALEEKLNAWEADDNIKAVLIRSNCEKAFCAGGDIRAVYEKVATDAYFRREYNINKKIFHYKKPYIALINGITMGGGVGLSVHAAYRVASPDLRFAMPETLIGFFPDVGAGYHLSRLDNHVGTFLALTGNSISAQDAFDLKLVDAIVDSHQFDQLEKEMLACIAEKGDLANVIKNRHQSAGKKTLPIDKISHYFSHDSVSGIIQALSSANTEWENETVTQLSLRSPTSLKVTLEQLKRAKQASLDQVIEMDYHIAKEMLHQHDFFEGIRAAIIDKDKNPKWQPALLQDVTEKMVGKYF